MSDNITERNELADLLADSIFRYTGVTTSSSKTMADELLAAGYRRPRTITTVDELNALPDDSLVVASGQYLSDGGFTDCWIRPIPAHITGGEGKRSWEVLIYLDGGPHNITYAEHVKFPATVLHEPEATL